MGWLDSFLHPEKGYQSAQNALNQYYNQGQSYLNPFMQHGNEAYGGLNSAFQALLDPAALRDKWESGYETSEAAKHAQDMAREQGLTSANAQGLGGSSAALKAIQSGTANIGMEDKQNYLNDLMQKYMQGIGLGQNIYNTGAGAAGQMNNNAMNMGNNSAQLAFGQKNAPGNMFSNILNGVATIGTPLLQGWMGNKMGIQPWTTGGTH